jgi:uncharacterized protein (DUF697 family)
VVLTQVRSRDGELHADAVALAEYIAALDLPIADGRPILVMAKGDEWAGEVQHGLKDLLDATFRVIPEGVENALAAAQKIDLDIKRKKATAAVVTASASAGVVGGVPIPIADATLLVPLQLGMIASVSVIYGIKAETAGLAATLVPSIATGAGRAAVTGLLKLIPGAGSIVGGVVSAGTAGMLTGAMGYAWIAVCEQLVQGRLKSVDGLLDRDAVRALFGAEFSTWSAKLMPGRSKRR